MVGDVSIHPAEPDVLDETSAHVDPGWITLVWNDPVNLMSYVTFVFQTYFGFSRDKAELLMLDVHHKGRAVVAHGPREQMERHVAALHEYGLWATFQKDE
ncbi:MAG: ATP-dependent Clp protease adapter ClpS [Mobilicoccus sp.]|nr:ATP-dependent Clp protease adapter ClpS [Mobilicoccus sp.]